MLFVRFPTNLSNLSNIHVIKHLSFDLVDLCDEWLRDSNIKY